MLQNSPPSFSELKTTAWFRKICDLSTENSTLTIHILADANLKKIIGFWSKTTGIPKEQFKKTQIDRRPNKSSKKKRKLPYGTAHLVIKSNGKREFGVYLHRRIMGWIEAVLNQIKLMRA